MQLSFRPVLFACAAAILLLFAHAAGADERRVALVIGNTNYAHAPRLPTSVNDADDIAGVLTHLGFDVVLRRDTTAADIRSAFDEFSRKSDKADIAIVYYAGYSLNAGVNGYLVPVDARLVRPSDLRTETIPLRQVMAGAGRARSLGWVILDALHGNPFPGKIGTSNISHDADATPTQSSGSRNVLLLFATEPRRTSEPGNGRNSPLAAALLENLPKPGLEINFLLRNVRDHVRHSTRSRQTPYMYGQLSKQKIFLASAGDPASLPSPADTSKAQPCDELAAEPDDADRHPNVAGVALETIATANAVPACLDAVQRFPAVSRFHYQLGRAYFAAHDYDAALTSYKKAFELGNVRALFALGAMYDHGDGVDQDPARARFYYEIAARMKFAPAITRLGMQYERGNGVPQDVAKAFELYRDAADLGDAHALNRMGELTEKGLGVAADARSARMLYEKSANMGDPEATVNLARCYANGIGGRKDIREARKLLAKAAKAGSTQARNILAATAPPERKANNRAKRD